jgi:hypothetical protein
MTPIEGPWLAKTELAKTKCESLLNRLQGCV